MSSFVYIRQASSLLENYYGEVVLTLGNEGDYFLELEDITETRRVRVSQEFANVFMKEFGVVREAEVS